MEMLPFISLVLWSTALCTAALVGFAIRDAWAARARAKPNRIPQSAPTDRSAGRAARMAARIRERLLKIA